MSNEGLAVENSSSWSLLFQATAKSRKSCGPQWAFVPDINRPSLCLFGGGSEKVLAVPEDHLDSMLSVQRSTRAASCFLEHIFGFLFLVLVHLCSISCSGKKNSWESRRVLSCKEQSCLSSSTRLLDNPRSSQSILHP